MPSTADLARQAALLELTHDTIMVRDMHDRIVYWNRGAELRYGWSREEAVGRVTHELLCTEFPQPLEQIQQQLLTEGRWEGELVHRRRDDTRIVVASRWALERDSDGAPSGVLELNNDITLRRRAEEEVLRSREQLRLAIEAGEFVTWEWDVETGQLTWGGWPGLLDHLPTSGSSEDLLRRIHPDDRAEVERAVANAFHRRERTDIEFRIVEAGGGTRWLAAHGRAVETAPGRVLRLTGLLRDVTARKALEQQLAASQKLEAIGRLAGGVAHDFNNLLTAIIGFEELARDPKPAADISETLDGIRQAADRAAALTRQLLGFARKQVVAPRVVRLHDLVVDAQMLLERVLREDIRLRIAPCAELSSVRIDPGQFEQIVVNLAVNARDALPTGGSLTISTENVTIGQAASDEFPDVPAGKYVLTTVIDDGIGMTEEARRHAFEPFFTTKATGRGTGLGLATVYGIVRQNGGHISMSSVFGHGTRFDIFLPAIDVPPERVSTFRMPPSKLFSGSATVLVVEDDPAVRGVTVSTLELAGYTVLQARHGEEALTLSRGHRGSIDLLVTDVVMPGLPVTEFVAALRAERPGIRVLYISGHAENAIVHHGVLDEGVAFLSKPFTPTELSASVRDALAGQESEEGG